MPGWRELEAERVRRAELGEGPAISYPQWTCMHGQREPKHLEYAHRPKLSQLRHQTLRPWRIVPQV